MPRKPDPQKIRLAMSRRGWISHDRLTYMGWGNDIGPGRPRFGYSIWFERWEWHGQRCDKVCYHAHTCNLSEIPETVQRAARLAKRAWKEFPDVPPSQGLGDQLDNAANKVIWKAAGLYTERVDVEI